jgi:hypothetical protein
METGEIIAALTMRPAIQRALAACGATGMSLGAGLVAYFDPSKFHFLPVCPVLAATGFACPGCGLTRGFHELFHGRLIPALDLNLLIPVWAVIFGYLFLALLIFAVRGRWLRMWLIDPKFLITFFIILVGFGVARNIPLWPFTILFP